MCSIGARVGANELKIAIHYEGVDVALRWMKKSFGKAADDLEVEALPKAYGAVVGADDEIELHGAKAAFAGTLQGMLAHSSGDASACSGGRGDVAAIGDVRSASFLVGLQIVGTDDFVLILGDKDLTFGREPIRESALLVHVARKSVGFARADNWLQDRPDSFGVVFAGGEDQHRCSLPRMAIKEDGLRMNRSPPFASSKV
jgi:hypothetical protein